MVVLVQERGDDLVEVIKSLVLPTEVKEVLEQLRERVFASEPFEAVVGEPRQK
jgi:hypothetical protein